MNGGSTISAAVAAITTTALIVLLKSIDQPLCRRLLALRLLHMADEARYSVYFWQNDFVPRRNARLEGYVLRNGYLEIPCVECLATDGECKSSLMFSLLP